MSFLEVLSIVLSAAGLYASILGAFLAVASRHNGEATRTLVRELTVATQDLIRSMEERMTAMLERMDQRTERMDERTERMDQRADERHREVIEAIRTFRT